MVTNIPRPEPPAQRIHLLEQMTPIRSRMPREGDILRTRIASLVIHAKVMRIQEGVAFLRFFDSSVPVNDANYLVEILEP